MRTGVIVDVSPADRERLAAIAVDRSSLQKHVWRARISWRPHLARVAKLSTGNNSRFEFSPTSGLDSTHAHGFGRCYRNSKLSLGFFSPKLI